MDIIAAYYPFYWIKSQALSADSDPDYSVRGELHELRLRTILRYVSQLRGGRKKLRFRGIAFEARNSKWSNSHDP